MSKRYGATTALDGVSCRFAPGEVHALLGENGAGKSTLVGILAGFVRPSSGRVTLGERELPLGDPLGCRAAGVELVHQHFTLAPGLTVAENLELTRMGTVTGWRSGEIVRRARAIAEDLGWDLPLGSRAESLGVAARQRVEIVKALAGEARVLILDEPTASLAPAEATEVFRVLRRLAEGGRTVILIAHKLSEVRAVADRVTVLRSGTLVGSGAMADLTDERLVEWMIGRAASPVTPSPIASGEPQGLQLIDVSTRGTPEPNLHAISLEVGTGLLGIGGVEGNGQARLAELLAGLVRYEGETRFLGARRDLADLDCGYIPEDRWGDGLAPSLSIERNLDAGRLARRESGGVWIDRARSRSFAERVIGTLGVRAPGPSTIVGTLSGGNAQKVVVGRALNGARDLIVAHNPTRGLDLGARETIHAALRAESARCPVVILTSDLDELFALSDEVGFLSRGRLRMGRDPALMGGWA